MSDFIMTLPDDEPVENGAQSSSEDESSEEAETVQTGDIAFHFDVRSFPYLKCILKNSGAKNSRIGKFPKFSCLCCVSLTDSIFFSFFQGTALGATLERQPLPWDFTSARKNLLDRNRVRQWKNQNHPTFFERTTRVLSFLC
jgi:hypothetical protein